MHSYIVIGKTDSQIEKKITEIVALKNLIRIDFEILKIGDVRDIISFTKLKTPNPTAFIIKNIQSATIEALNAFLKLLEEPHPNNYFILTAPSVHEVIPTILSRCQIIYTKIYKTGDHKDLAEIFLSSDELTKLEMLQKLKIKEEAISFLENILIGLHSLLINKKEKSHIAKKISEVNFTLQKIKANGNLFLQLSCLAIT